jgi:DNA invertase Pin-like site-specific DNA recombinase
MERPALQRLLADIRAGRIEVVVTYKVDRLTRALADFARLIEIFDKHEVSFVSVTQQFNTTTSMGRLTLNVLLSFAQFEREVTGERIRDKIAASKQRGMWMGGNVPLGYELVRPQARNQPAGSRHGSPPLYSLSRTRLRAAGQGDRRPARLHDKAPHREGRRARRKAVLPRAHL